MAKKKAKVCCPSCGRFPWLAVLLLVVGALWFLSELKVLSLDIPWWPLVVMIFSLKMIIHHKMHMK
ncbi:hypothetical protein ACFL0E_00565 [Nanoarchaeota archaeon]